MIEENKVTHKELTVVHLNVKSVQSTNKQSVVRELMEHATKGYADVVSMWRLI